MPEPDERELIERLASGDRSAFQEFVESYKNNVYGLAFDLTRNHHDAEDVSQEVFIKVFRSFHTFRKDARLGSWLYRITVNACHDHRRRRPRESEAGKTVPGIDGRPSVLEALPGTDLPEKTGDAHLLQIRINRALDSVSERERTAFVLRYYEDLDLKSIAEIMDISVGAVKSYLFRGIQKLQKELADFHGGSLAEVTCG
ncbi:MAG: RNA polymerase sigma factor [Candidatus Aminicenantales bacterium]